MYNIVFCNKCIFKLSSKNASKWCITSLYFEIDFIFKLSSKNASKWHITSSYSVIDCISNSAQKLLQNNVLTPTHTSTTPHLSTTSNISTKLAPNELKLCTCAVVYVIITIAVFFWCKAARKLKFWNRPLSRMMIDGSVTLVNDMPCWVWIPAFFGPLHGVTGRKMGGGRCMGRC
jgi:hypothetical protein